MFKFNPNEIAVSLESGKYLAKVDSIDVRTSSSGNQMIELKFTPANGGGKSPIARLVATEKALFNWQNCWKSAGYNITDANMSVEKMVQFLNNKKHTFQIEIFEKENTFFDQTEQIEKKTMRKEVKFIPQKSENLKEINLIKIENNKNEEFNNNNFTNSNSADLNSAIENDLPF
jgi:hypothetical protein